MNSVHTPQLVTTTTTAHSDNGNGNEQNQTDSLSQLHQVIDSAQLDISCSLTNIKRVMNDRWNRLEVERQRLQQWQERLDEKMKENEQREQELKEKCEHIEHITAKMDQIQRKSQSKVKLNIGGFQFTTSTHTLTQDKDSIFCAMFSGAFSTDYDPEADEHFIDRDGSLFHLLIKHLRGYDIGRDVSELSVSDRELLAQEVDFYQVKSMSHLLIAHDARNDAVVECNEMGDSCDSSWRNSCASCTSSTCSPVVSQLPMQDTISNHYHNNHDMARHSVPMSHHRHPYSSTVIPQNHMATHDVIVTNVNISAEEQQVLYGSFQHHLVASGPQFQFTTPQGTTVNQSSTLPRVPTRKLFEMRRKTSTKPVE